MSKSSGAAGLRSALLAGALAFAGREPLGPGRTKSHATTATAVIRKAARQLIELRAPANIRVVAAEPGMLADLMVGSWQRRQSFPDAAREVEDFA